MSEYNLISRREFIKSISAFGVLSFTTASNIGFLNAQVLGQSGPRVRRSSTDSAFGSEASEQYREAVRAIKALPNSDDRSWASLVEVHGSLCPHHNWYFLPWHRAYLLAVEAIGTELTGDSSFAIPYWNWTDYRQLPPAFVNPSEGGNTNSLFHAGRRMSGNATLSTVLAPFGVDAEQIFGSASMETIQDETVFQLFGSFKNQQQDSIDTSWQRRRGRASKLERESHDYGHGAVGGDMGDPGVSPNDPIFYLHHGNLDRLWAHWNSKGRQNETNSLWREFVFRANFPSAGGTPNPDITVSDLENTLSLGYVYDDLPALPLLAPPIIGAESSIGFLASTKQNFSSIAEIARTTALPLAATPALQERVQDIVLKNAGQRIIAFINNVTPPKETDINVRVFVNCDYLTPTTRVDDPHYAGGFTFFVNPEHVSHGKLSYAIDITDTLRKIRSTEQEIEIQLMPLTYDGRLVDGNSFEVGDVEIAVL